MRNAVLLLAATAVALSPAVLVGASGRALPRPARGRRSAAPASELVAGIRRRRDRRRAPLMSNRSAAASRPFRASPIPAQLPLHDPQFRGRERLRGAGRLCLHHPPADDADGRRVAARLRARPRNRPHRRQPRAGAQVRGAAQFGRRDLRRAARQRARRRARQRDRADEPAARPARDAQLLARPGISGRHARHALFDRGGLRSGRRPRRPRRTDPGERAARRGSRAAPTARRRNGRAPIR